MTDTKRAAELAVRIAEVAKHVESQQDDLRVLAAELTKVLAAELKPPATGRPGFFIRGDRRPAPAPPPVSARGRAGNTPDKVIRLLSGEPDQKWKPREIAGALGYRDTQARSLSITLLRMRKEGRVRFHKDTKTYSHAA